MSDPVTARFAVLAEASNAFAEVVTDYPRLLERIARATADLVGDGCLVNLVDRDGLHLASVACAHRDRELERVYIEYVAQLSLSTVTSAAVAATVVRTGTPAFATEVDPAIMVARSDEILRPLVARLNVHSYAVVPIRARDRIIGTLSILRSRPAAGYDVDDLALLQDIANRAGLAIESARLYDDLERRVAERTAELAESNRELEAFSYSVAHDLRAPLRAIDGFSQSVLDRNAERLDETSRRHLQRVRDAAGHMNQLIEDLLSLARITRSELQRSAVDLSALADAVIERLRQAHPTRDVEVTIQPGIVVDADPRLLDVVLTNLIGNAWKFTGKREHAQIEVGADAQTGATYFVRDNGAGFDAERATNLFGAFQRYHDRHDFEGTGIGLAIVQRVIRRHGGRIWASAEIDRGATFHFTLTSGDA